MKWQEAIEETMAIERQIQEKIETMRKECMNFAWLLKVVIDGRKKEASDLDIRQIRNVRHENHQS